MDVAKTISDPPHRTLSEAYQSIETIFVEGVIHSQSTGPIFTENVTCTLQKVLTYLCFKLSCAHGIVCT